MINTYETIPSNTPTDNNIDSIGYFCVGDSSTANGPGSRSAAIAAQIQYDIENGVVRTEPTGTVVASSSKCTVYLNPIPKTSNVVEVRTYTVWFLNKGYIVPVGEYSYNPKTMSEKSFADNFSYHDTDRRASIFANRRYWWDELIRDKALREEKKIPFAISRLHISYFAGYSATEGVFDIHDPNLTGNRGFIPDGITHTPTSNQPFAANIANTMHHAERSKLPNSVTQANYPKQVCDYVAQFAKHKGLDPNSPKLNTLEFRFALRDLK